MAETVKKTTDKAKSVEEAVAKTRDKKKKVTILENVKLGKRLLAKGTVIEVSESEYEELLSAKVIEVEE